MDTLSNSKLTPEQRQADYQARFAARAETAEKRAEVAEKRAEVAEAKVATEEPSTFLSRAKKNLEGLLMAACVCCFIYISLYCMGAAFGLVLGAGMATFNSVVGK